MAFFREENFWLYAPLILWISGIFYFSSGRGSISRTARYFIPLLVSLFPNSDARTLEKYHVVARKLCHPAGYAVLALLASAAFYNSSVAAAARFWYACAFAVVLIVASVDEIRQSFYPERSGSPSDVALDCVGGLTVILLFWIFAANGF